MNYKKLIGFGVLIWGIIYLVASGLVAYNVADALWAEIVILIAIAIVVYLVGKNVGADSVASAAKYSVSWVIIALILDAVFTTPFTGWEIFSQWNVLLGYAIILLLPLLLTKGGGGEQSAPTETPQTPTEQPPLQ